MSFGFNVVPWWFSSFDHHLTNTTMFAYAVGSNLTVGSDLHAGRCLQWTSTGNAVQLTEHGHPGAVSDSTVVNVTGVWVKLGTVGGSLPAPGICLMSEGSLASFSSTPKLSRSLVLGANGSLEVWRNFDDPSSRVKMLNTANNVLPAPGAWFRLEVESFPANTSASNDGVYNLQVNGTNVLSHGALPDTGNYWWEILGPYVTNGTGANVQVQMDDCYHMREYTRHPVVTDFLGNWTVERLRPRSNATYSGLTLSAGSDHWSAVADDAQDDGASSYVSDTTVPLPYLRDTFHYDALITTSGTPLAVFGVLGLHNNHGGPYFTNDWVEGEADDRNTSQIYPDFINSPGTSAWVYGKRYLGQDPNTLADWTRSGVNGLLMGPMSTAGLEVTQALVEVLVQTPVYPVPVTHSFPQILGPVEQVFRTMVEGTDNVVDIGGFLSSGQNIQEPT